MKTTYLSSIPEAVVEQKSLPEAMRRYNDNLKHAENREDLRQRMGQVLSTLSYREREILKLRYGVGVNLGYTCTLEEVGKIFKVTRERIRQIETRAIQKLGRPPRSSKLVDFIDKCRK
jgi:RNA polymerase primary sigma factor